MRGQNKRRVRMLNYRATPVDAALLALVAGRISRSRSDTLRLLVRAAAAELGESLVRPSAESARMEGGHEQ